jgi:DNA polymerase
MEDAASALHLKVKKDVRKTETEGVRVLKAIHIVRKVSRPRKALKRELKAWAKAGITPPAILWHESRELFEALWAYCRLDVLAEEAISLALEDTNDHETELFLLDLVMNTRGFQLDMDAVNTALRLVAHESDLLNRELSDVTNGYVDKASQRENMKLWFASEDLVLPDTKGETIDAYLSPQSHIRLSKTARRALELMRALGRSSTAKYQAMANWVDRSDGRVRGGLLYHGASTGRWSGKGVQPHNFPKLSPKPKDQKDKHPDDMSNLWDALKTKTRAHIIKRWTGVMEALSAALRGAITARPGKVLYVADFASIEARVLLWVAQDEKGLDLFRRHEDPYCDMAADIFHRPVTKADERERAIGKIAILGLGYQMGPSKFVDTCAKGGVIIPEDVYCEECGKGSKSHRKERHEFQFFDGEDDDTMTAVKVVDAYRSKYWRVKQVWEDQEASAIAAVQSRQPVTCGPVTWTLKGNFLYCVLPSGRRLAYCEPRVKSQMMPWGKEKLVLSYMGVDSYTHQWRRQSAYGGLLTENIVQAIARDLMADGMLRAEATGIYEMVLSVHDELIAEADEGAGSVKEFELLMSECPPWATGCPVEAEGWSGKRYRK